MGDGGTVRGFRPRGAVAGVAALALSLGAIATVPSAVPASAGPAQTGPQCDWAMFGHDPARSFASADGCSAISKLTAPALRPKWYVDTSGPVTAQPAVVDGVVYVGDYGGKFHALRSADGSPAWTSPFDVTKFDANTASYGQITSSAAVATVADASGGHATKVVVFGGGGTLFVLDALTGTRLASQCLDAQRPQCDGGLAEIESSPVILPQPDGSALVLVGSDVNEASGASSTGLFEFRVTVSSNPSGGTNVALTPQWKFDPETGVTYRGATLLTDGGTGHGCGDVWSSPTIFGGLVVFGAGNCNSPQSAPYPQTEATWALNFAPGMPADGTVAWQRAPRAPGNGLDEDFGATPNVLPGGVGEGGKDGNYYAYDAAGKLLWPPVSVAAGSDIGGMIASAAVGSANARPAVFAVSAIPVSTGDTPGSLQTIATAPTKALGVHAIDATTGAKLWDAAAGPVYGAAVYAGGVVLVPDTFTDSLLALDADTGVVLRAQPLNAPPSSPVAVVGNSLYLGSGTDVPMVGGIWGFQTTP